MAHKRYDLVEFPRLWHSWPRLRLLGHSANGLQRSFVSFSSIDKIWAMRFARVSGFLAE